MRRLSASRLIVTLGPSLLLLAIVLVARVRFGITTSAMTGDIADFAGVHPLTGFLSSLGSILWFVSAAVPAFTAAALPTPRLTPVFGFLVSSALLSAWMGFDDLFVFHDWLAPNVLGIPESIAVLALAVAGLGYLIVFRTTIVRLGPGMLVLSLLFLGASIFLDQFVTHGPSYFPGAYFLEDGTKWLGIACWCSYHIGTSYQIITGDSRISSGR